MADILTVRLALVGCGEVTRYKHLPALRRVKGVEVVAVADHDAVRRQRVASMFGIPRQVADVESVLELPQVDAVGVCVPPHAHRSVALAALGADRAVWVDKPLACTEADAIAIADAASRSRRTVMMGFHMRWHPQVQRARDTVRRGLLGTVESIRSTWFSPRNDDDLPDWRIRRESGGGSLIEIGVHHFDLWRYLLDDEVEEVFARARDGVRDDECAVVSARTRSGIMAVAVLSERAPHQIEVEICGSKGRLRLSCLQFEGFEMGIHGAAPGSVRSRLRNFAHLARELPRGIRSLLLGGDYHDSYRGAWQHFMDCVRSGQPAVVAAEDGVRAAAIVEAVIQSRLSNLPVPLAGEKASVG